MLVSFRIVLTGALNASSRVAAEAMIRGSLSLTLPLHDGVAEVLIETKPMETIEDMGAMFRRKGEQP